MTQTFPVIRFEVQGMKHAIAVALTEYAAKMDADIQLAVQRACEPDVVSLVIEEAAGKAIREVIAEEVTNFFRYGAGRRAVKEAVERKLDTKTT